jgi:DNA-binding beta-propeller fold protein YncE
MRLYDRAGMTASMHVARARAWRRRERSLAHAASALVLALGAASLCAGALATGSADAAGLYVGNVNTPNVSQYLIGPGGALAPITPGTVAAEAHPAAVAISPDGTSVYVPNFGSESVSQYNVAASGALTPKSPAIVPTAGAEPVALAVSPDGRSVYVADAGSNRVAQYDVGLAGALTPKSPATVNTGERPMGVAVSPDGSSVYVSNLNGNSISQYNVSASGTLSPKSVPTVTASRPVGIAVNPDGGSVYAADSSVEAVAQYSVGPGGALSPKSPATLEASTSPFGVVVSPDGRSVYVIDESGTVSISQYDAGPSGALTPKSPPSFTIAGLPSSMAFSPDGASAYIGNPPPANTILQYNVGASGILTPKSPATVADPGEYPGSLAVTPDQGPLAAFFASVAAAGAPSAFNASSSFDPDGSIARYDWSFGDGTGALAAGPKPTHTYAAPGTYTVTVQVTDNAGCSAAEVFTGQTAYCNASPAAIASHPVTVPAAPLPAPAIGSARESASKWREGSKLPQISRKKRKPPVGTTFSFSLNEQASVSFTFTQRVAGRKVGRRCLAKSRKNARGRSCTRTVTAGLLSLAGHAGTNKVVFQGRISRSQKLKPGRYTLVITATNAAGARSAPASLSFTIVK